MAEMEEANESDEGNQQDNKTLSGSVRKAIISILTERTSQHAVHSTKPSLNASRYNINRNPISKSEWKISLPSPVYSSSTGILETDRCLKRAFEYRRYTNNIRWLPNRYKGLQAQKIYRKCQKRGIYNYKIISMAEALERNPDVYYSGNYDWYFTGGNLARIDCDNGQYVVHAEGKRLQNVYVSKVDTDLDTIKLTNVFRKKSKVITDRNNNPEIVEIQTFNDNNVSVRRRNYISLYSFTDNASLKYRFHIRSSPVPFISSTKESKHSANVVTSDLSKTVALWDLNVSAEKPKQLLFSTPDLAKDKNWNYVQYLDENMYALVDTKKLFILDARQPSLDNVVGYDLHSKEDVCEINTIMQPSRFNDLIYIGTTHKLLAIDKRYLKRNTIHSEHIVLKWKHMMTGYPLMLDVNLMDNVETILLSSYENGEVCLIENNRIRLKDANDSDDTELEFVYDSPNIPTRPPTIKDAYRTARMEGLCLNPYTSMARRSSYFHCGISFLSNDNFMSYLIANSNGDIFSQMLVRAHDEEMINEYNLGAMKQWNDTLLEMNARQPTVLNVTSVENLNSLKTVFRSDQLDKADNDDLNDLIEDDDIVRRTAHRRLGKWQQSVRKLQQYKDALAADILSIWDLENDNADTTKLLVLPTQETPADTDMVGNWLEHSKVAEASESALIESNISLDIFNEAVLVNDSLNQSLAGKKEKKTLKRKYVKGF